MNLSELFPGDVTPWQMVFAALSILAGWILSRFARKGVLTLALKTPGITDSVAQLIARATQYGILLIGIGIGLAFLGANVQPLLAMTAVALVVIVIVLRGVADNFAAGVLLQSRQPIRVGEQVTVDALGERIDGIVHELNGRSVVLATSDGRILHVPNAVLMGDVLINDSRYGSRRSEVEVRVRLGNAASHSDIARLILKAAEEAPGLDPSQHPSVALITASSSRAIMIVRFWHHPRQSQEVTSDVVERVSRALTQSGIAHTATSERTTPPLPPAEQI